MRTELDLSALYALLDLLIDALAPVARDRVNFCKKRSLDSHHVTSHEGKIISAHHVTVEKVTCRHVTSHLSDKSCDRVNASLSAGDDNPNSF